MNNLNQTLLNEQNENITIEMQSQDMNEVITDERVIAINHLATDVQQVGELFSDMALLVNAQGENIDNIETNIQNSSTNIEGANVQLIKANKYQKRKRRCAYRCICFLLIAITISIIILIIKIQGNRPTIKN
jgi:t-SNARE complex subunit (syntaxin)